MSLPDQTPKLPKLPFLLGDAVLVGAAWYIASRDPGPLTVQAMAAVTVCVVAAAIVGAVPFLADYARRQDEALDERQRGLEALSRTISTAAEQIGIAANGFNELTDLTHKNLKQADQLPQKLQEKIAEFKAQLDNARENDREELEKEVAELRTSETDRLQTVSEKVHKAVGELTRLESALQQHLRTRTAENEHANATHATAHAEATQALRDAHAALIQELASAQAKILSAIDQRLPESTKDSANPAERSAPGASPMPAAATPAAIPATSDEPAESTSTPVVTEGVAEVASPPKRPRKPRREESPAPVAPTPSESPAPDHTNDSAPSASTGSAIIVEPAPVPAETIAQIQPVAPDSGTPFTQDLSATPVGLSDPANALPSPPLIETDLASTESTVDSGIQTPRTNRKRTAQKPASGPAADVPFQLVSDEHPPMDDSAITDAEMVESVLSSDGATRLIATSYIGIGNRLFIRGEGPGLSWERGVPLQFISIGKWRWETTEAASPISFKLYKNDAVECAGLGVLTLEPGHQQEVTAKF